MANKKTAVAAKFNSSEVTKLVRTEPKVFALVNECTKFQGEQVHCQTDVSFFTDLTETDLYRWMTIAIHNLTFNLNVLRCILFARAVKRSRFFEKYKSNLINENKKNKMTANAPEKNYIPYEVQVKLQYWAVSAFWFKVRWICPKRTWQKVYAQYTYIKQNRTGGYSKTVFNAATPKSVKEGLVKYESFFDLYRRESEVIGKIIQSRDVLLRLEEKYFHLTNNSSTK